MDQERLLKNYLRDVIMFSERLNLHYYVKLTENTNLRSRKELLKLNELMYDNSTTIKYVQFADRSYENLRPYIETGNLTVSKNLLEIVSSAIEFLIEDLKNIQDLITTGIANAEIIKDYVKVNVGRLRKILALN